MNGNVNKLQELNELRIGDFIFLVWIVNSLIGLLSNLIEEDSIKNHKQENVWLVHNIRLVAIYIALTIYIYLFIKSYQGVISNINNNDPQAVTNTKVKLITSILFISAGLLLLYLEHHNENDDTFDLYV